MNIRKGIVFRWFAAFVVLIFMCVLFFSDFLRIKETSAVIDGVVLPPPMRLLFLSKNKEQPLFKGIRVNPQDPFDIEFVLDAFDEKDVSDEVVQRLVRYFLAGLAVPADKLWVNLSPFESERIIPDELVGTDIANTLLTEDYFLKQISSSLTHPDTKTGKSYWQQINSRASFNKIWIVPGNIEVFEEKELSIITKAELDVKTELDYFAMQNNGTADDPVNEAVRNVLIPQIKKDVNNGENFARLRQLYSSLILAAWFKHKFTDSLFALFFDQEKIAGIDTADTDAREKVYKQYVTAFKKGVYDIVREDAAQVRRNYFSGGAFLGEIAQHSISHANSALIFFKKPFALRVSSALDKISDRRTFIRELLAGAAGLSFFAACGSKAESTAAADTQREPDNKINVSAADNTEVEESARALLAFINNSTGLPVSHIGQSQMKDWVFTYDAAVAAMALYAAGYKKQAERITDYFVQHYRNSSVDIVQGTVEANDTVCSIKSPYNGQVVNGFFTAVSASDNSRSGAAREWKSGPGPIAFLIKAMIMINKDGYKDVIKGLAEFLSGIQAPDGGFVRGVVAEERGLVFNNFTDTEPHLDAMHALIEVYQITSDLKYKNAAAKAYRRALDTVVRLREGNISQGISANGQKNFIHATDVYTWGGPMLLSAGVELGLMSEKNFSLDMIRNLVTHFEDQSLVKVTYERSDGAEVTVTGTDFTDPSSDRVISMRKEYHPQVSAEWSRGAENMYKALAVIAARQAQQDRPDAQEWKDYSIVLKAKGVAQGKEVSKMGFLRAVSIDGRSVRARFFSYATGLRVPTGHGWNTPDWNSKDGPAAQGPASNTGSAWTILNGMGINLFGFSDRNLTRELADIYDLPAETGSRLLAEAVKSKPYRETGAKKFNAEEAIGWTSQDVMVQGFKAYEAGDYQKAIRVIEERIGAWEPAARTQQNDKMSKVGGIIATQWGSVGSDDPALKYIYKHWPLLNEVGAMKWILTASNFQLGRKSEAKRHMRDIIKLYSLAQVHDPYQRGIWYPIRSFERAESGKQVDRQLQQLYEEVISEPDMSRPDVREISWETHNSRYKENTEPQQHPVVEKQALSERNASVDLMALGSPDHYDYNSQWKAKAEWLEFSPSLTLEEGDIIEINYTLKNAQGMGVELKPFAVSDNDPGIIEVFSNAEGADKTIRIKVEYHVEIRRLVFQLGERAWTYDTYGSRDAKLIVHSAKVKKADSAISGAALKGGIDFNSVDRLSSSSSSSLSSVSIMQKIPGSDIIGIRFECGRMVRIEDIHAYIVHESFTG